MMSTVSLVISYGVTAVSLTVSLVSQCLLVEPHSSLHMIFLFKWAEAQYVFVCEQLCMCPMWSTELHYRVRVVSLPSLCYAPCKVLVIIVETTNIFFYN